MFRSFILFLMSLPMPPHPVDRLSSSSSAGEVFARRVFFHLPFWPMIAHTI